MLHPSVWLARHINKMEIDSMALFMRPCVPLLLLQEQVEEAEEGQHRESSRLPGIYGPFQLSCGEATGLPHAHIPPDVKSLQKHVAHAHSPACYMRGLR